MANRDTEAVAKYPRQWTDDDLMLMIDRILQGYTYRDVTEGTLVPMSTLWTR